MKKKRYKILVVGARGLIGGRLCRFLKKKNYLIRKTTRKNIKGFKKINWKSKNNLEKHCSNIDIVINCSGADVHQSKNLKVAREANVKNNLNLYTASSKVGVKLFIYISSYHVYNFDLSEINENSKLLIKDNHTRSKIESELKLKRIVNNKTPAVVLRPCNLFGWPMYPNNNTWKLIINQFLIYTFNQKKFTVKSNLNVFRYYSSIESFCEFIFLLIYKKNLFKKNFNVVNFTSNKKFHINNLLNFVQKKLVKFFKIKIIINYKYPIMKKQKIFKFTSTLQKKIYKVEDKNFLKEVKFISNNIKKNKLWMR